jgi:hypothetical protein
MIIIIIIIIISALQKNFLQHTEFN